MKRIAGLLLILCIALGTFAGLYFFPHPVNDSISIWLSNDRCVAFDEDGNMIVKYANITIASDGETMLRDNGLVDSLYVGNITTISMLDGIVMWANDSQNIFSYPLVSLDYPVYSELFGTVDNVKVTLHQGNLSQIIPHSNIDKEAELTQFDINLDDIESLINTSGNTSYTLTLSVDINFHVAFSTLPLLSTTPSIINDRATVDLGNLTVDYIDGHRSYVQINFPYSELSYSIYVPFIETVLP
ncbi:MAG: hypothetical protein NWF01_07175 [Candidatus Bathyarchaeota archaeon]|nr:hypothetical protein [Candidatus Bathyarchaeota archaeon]